MERINVENFERARGKELVFPDGEVWAIRVPADGDRYTWQRLANERRARLQEWGKQVQAMADAERERLDEEGDLEPVERNRRVREFINSQVPPDNVTDNYLDAAQLAVLIDGEPTPDVVLERLAFPTINALVGWAKDILRGGEGKNLLGEASES